MKRTEHREDRWQFPFVMYSPDEERDGLALIVQLHGAGERGDGKGDLSLVDVHGFSKTIKEKDFPCIFVMPQCPRDTFWAARVESIISFIKEIIDKYKINPDRIYLTGLSMGGYGTWFTAMARPDIFAAIAPVCGGGMAWNADVLDMPIWVFHGSDDTVVSPSQSDEMVAKLKALDKDVRYSRIDGVGHGVWENAYNEELINWLLDKTRKQ